MIPLVMKMLHVLPQRMAERRFPKQDEPREALLLHGSYPPLRVGVQIRRPWWQWYPFHPRCVDDPCAPPWLSLIAEWCLMGETLLGQPWTPALRLPQVRYGLSLLLLEVFYTPGVDSICRQVQRQLMRNELARFYHYRTRNCIPPR